MLVCLIVIGKNLQNIEKTLKNTENRLQGYTGLPVQWSRRDAQNSPAVLARRIASRFLAFELATPIRIILWSRRDCEPPSYRRDNRRFRLRLNPLVDMWGEAKPNPHSACQRSEPLWHRSREWRKRNTLKI